MLSDTGFFARNVLGMDTDRGANGVPEGEEGRGGIRNSGKHQQMVAFVDDFSIKHKVLLAPRKSYKSSLVEALIGRVILSRPNWCILLLMHDYEMACQRITVIRDMLREHPVVRELYGDIKGPLWRKSEWTTNLRTDNTLLDPQIRVASPRKMKTGGHYHLLVVDDPIEIDDVVTPEAVDKAVTQFKFMEGLRARDAISMLVCTPYEIGDVAHFAMSLPTWQKLILPVENDVINLPDGRPALEGESGWPHLTNDRLAEHLALGFDYFMSQFKLRITKGMHRPFKREQFVPVKWKPEYADLTGYMLTDVSTSEKGSSNLNVLAYIGLDDKLRLHILDLQIGHWPIGDFCDRYLAMLARWSSKISHGCEIFEVAPANNGYKAMLAMKAQERKQRLTITMVPRGTGDLSKDQRILCLQPRFQNREVFVLDSISRTWLNESKIEMLWDPEGHVDPETGQRLPGGELVDQFIHFQPGASRQLKKDIPDAIANIDSLDKATGNRICIWRRPLRDRMPDNIVRPKSTNPAAGVASRFYQKAVSRIRTT